MLVLPDPLLARVLVISVCGERRKEAIKLLSPHASSPFSGVAAAFFFLAGQENVDSKQNRGRLVQLLCLCLVLFSWEEEGGVNVDGA